MPGAVVVPTADLFAERPDRLARDRFHPGPAGYDEIAARIVVDARHGCEDDLDCATILPMTGESQAFSRRSASTSAPP